MFNVTALAPPVAPKLAQIVIHENAALGKKLFIAVHRRVRA